MCKVKISSSISASIFVKSIVEGYGGVKVQEEQMPFSHPYPLLQVEEEEQEEEKEEGRVEKRREEGEEEELEVRRCSR